MPYITNAGLYLIQVLFDLYIFIMALRLIMHWVGVDYKNPIVQFVVKLTNPPLLPLRKIIPNLFGLDLVALIILLLLEIIKTWAIISLSLGITPHITGLIILSFGEILNQVMNIFFYSIFLMVILSWLGPRINMALLVLLFQLTEPLLRPMRRILPPIGGIDLSPIPLMILLKLCQMLIIDPLYRIGGYLALAGSGLT